MGARREWVRDVRFCGDYECRPLPSKQFTTTMSTPTDKTLLRATKLMTHVTSGLRLGDERPGLTLRYTLTVVHFLSRHKSVLMASVLMAIQCSKPDVFRPLHRLPPDWMKTSALPWSHALTLSHWLLFHTNTSSPSGVTCQRASSLRASGEQNSAQST